jgi:hypothetical protein
MLRSILIRPPSARDRHVHLVVGCLLPLLFVVVDPAPAVFRTGTILPFGGAYLGAYRAFGYAATALAALLLVRALNVSRASELEAGMLYGATGVAFLLGLVLLPLSMAGILFFGLGLLGFSPFAASWIYLRNGARQHAGKAGRLISSRSAAGLALFVLLPLTLQIVANGAVRWSVKRADTQHGQAGLRTMRWLYDADGLAWQYQSSQSDEEKRQLALAFKVMTGQNVESHLARLAD